MKYLVKAFKEGKEVGSFKCFDHYEGFDEETQEECLFVKFSEDDKEWTRQIILTNGWDYSVDIIEED